MNVNQIKENKLKMILGFSIPSIIAMLLQTIITITDGYFTGNYVGENALAAINLRLPVLYFYLGVGLCVGVGGYPQVCMLISVAGCILNMILDYVFVAVMNLGVRGSAIASLIVQIVTVLFSFGYFFSKKAGLKFSLFKFDRIIARGMVHFYRKISVFNDERYDLY